MVSEKPGLATLTMTRFAGVSTNCTHGNKGISYCIFLLTIFSDLAVYSHYSSRYNLCH